MNIGENMKTRIEKALEMARKAHMNQVDKAGLDYINHPIYVSSHCATEDEKIVGLLHDTVEDTDLTIDEIKEEFGDVIAEAVDAITHRKGEGYKEYLTRLKQNSIARNVKLQDILHNADISRIANPTESDLQRQEKYKFALDFLLFKK